MKKLVWLILLAAGFQLTAQTESALKKHYEDYYRQMRVQGDVRGVINALTHLNLLDYSVERRDTLAYVYANNDQHLQAACAETSSLEAAARAETSATQRNLADLRRAAVRRPVPKQDNHLNFFFCVCIPLDL